MNPFKNNVTASVAQQNWENRQPNQDVIPESEMARKKLKLELLNIQSKHPDADYEKLFDKLYQFAYVHEYDYILEGLDIVVDEIVSEVINDE